MALTIGRKHSLKEVGDGWENCYVLYRPATYDEITAFEGGSEKKLTAKESVQEMYTFLESHFVSGKVLDEGNLVDMNAAHLHELPRDVIDNLSACLLGGAADPKDEVPTETSSSTT